MTQSGQSTATRHLEPAAGETDGSLEIVRFGADRANETVEQALAQRQAVTTPSFTDGEAASTVHSPLGSPNGAGALPLVSFPPPPSPRRRRATFHALQEWEGHVVDVGEREFVARLVDLTAGRSHESEEAVIPMAEVSEYDAARMAVGSIFRWVIGHERSPEGTRSRVSRIVFRDLPRVTEADLRQGEEWARSVAPALGP